jgi:ABC-type lipoprotein export system ATPase subunit
MLELKNISKTYTDGQEVRALQGISLTINDGEFVAIKGPSGCGKSTLLHILGLLDSFDEGEYLIDGQRVDQLPGRQRAKFRNQMFGFVFQAFNLLARTSVLNNVMLPLRYRSSREDRNLAVQTVVKDVGLAERLHSLPNQLSGGQQQRVAIARALVGNPKIILADEPTGNLDSKTGLEIMALFKKINTEDKTIIMVTHNDELLDFASRVISMRDGKVISDVAR